MSNLLQTKLFTPFMPSGVIPRPHLVEQLNRGLMGKLSLVTAPAGYGKTTLVTTWLHQLDDAQVIWVSLDEGDNNSRRFFTYVTAALCQLDDSFVAIQDEFLQEARAELSLPALVTSLLNGLMAYGRRAVLILDDYHEIEEPSIHEALSLWLTHQPPNAHLVITSRTEPPLPLPRLRVRRQMTDIDTESLRFSRVEAADFLNQHMHLNLSADDIDQLDSITEGWVASLQLAALSLQNKTDPSAFIQTFKGDNHYIVDYLVNEVLQRQPTQIRDFLLQTSVLERLNVQLCDAVTEQAGSQQILETLDQSRLFVIPLDDRRHWYRYHHLFAGCLRAELQRIAPDEVAIYHERASHWYSQYGFLDDAIHHAFAAGSNQLAAKLIGDNARDIMSSRGELHRLWQWIQQLPEAQIRTSPQVLITTAWLHLDLFLDSSAHIATLLEDAVALIHADDGLYTPIEIATMTTEITLARASLARHRGDFAQAIAHTTHAIELAQETDSSILKMGSKGSLLICHYQAGNIAQFLQYSDPQMASIHQGGLTNYARYVFLSFMINALRLNGQLRKAASLYQHFEPSFSQHQPVGRALTVVSWTEVLREQNQLDLAAERLIPALDTLKPLQSMVFAAQAASMILARIRQAQGQSQDALDLIQDAQQAYRMGNAYEPTARPAATAALLHLRQGNLAAAKTWADTHRLDAHDTPTYLLEIAYLVFARILLADDAPEKVLVLLTKLAQNATDGGRVTRLIEMYTLQALAHQALGGSEQAITRLVEALHLAQPEGFVRVFVDEGTALLSLLTQVAQHNTVSSAGIDTTYIQQLLDIIEEEAVYQKSTATIGLSKTRQPVIDSPTSQNAFVDMPLDPLTTRELDTLRYLAGDLTIPKIAEQMIVAPSTVRSYVKTIYSKLYVHSRMEAVNRARTLGLLP